MTFLSALTSGFAAVSQAGLRVTQQIASTLLETGSTFSLFSLLAAMLVAAGFLILNRQRRRLKRRPLRIRVLLRALFPRHIRRHRSSVADLGFFLLNTCVTGILIGWGLLSGGVISRMTHDGLNHYFGALPASPLPAWAASLIITLMAFLAYDLGYWIDHYLKHKVPWLWAFHRVHHSAEVLTPLSTYRVHPVDSLIFSNILALVVGSVTGLVSYGLGGAGQAWLVSGTNLFLFIFVYAVVHLQHSHIRLAFTGLAGRLLCSPVHHQIHHSNNPAHYGCNLGSCLAIWDWMFGTLRVPDASHTRLTFGVEPDEDDPHSATGGLIYPFVMAARPYIARFTAQKLPKPASQKAIPLTALAPETPYPTAQDRSRD
jgi:sterol desaturase/sphingolipid hydroxylase (fatty acid hydroxylase superfamily)